MAKKKQPHPLSIPKSLPKDPLDIRNGKQAEKEQKFSSLEEPFWKAWQERHKHIQAHPEFGVPVEALDEQYMQPALQYQFVPTRFWRLDFAWPSVMVAVEMDGGVSMRRGAVALSSHVSPVGYARNMHKANAAQSLGWIVLRYTGYMFAVKYRPLVVGQVASTLYRRARQFVVEDNPVHAMTAREYLETGYPFY